MSACDTAYYQSGWFWMLIIGIIFIIAGVIVYFVYATTSWYVWILLVLGLIMVIIGAIWGYYISSTCAAAKKVKTVTSVPAVTTVKTTQGATSVPVEINIPATKISAMGTYSTPVCKPTIRV